MSWLTGWISARWWLTDDHAWWLKTKPLAKQDGKNAPKVRKGEDMAQTSGVFPQLTKGGKKKGGGKRGC